MEAGADGGTGQRAAGGFGRGLRYSAAQTDPAPERAARIVRSFDERSSNAKGEGDGEKLIELRMRKRRDLATREERPARS